MNKAIIQYEIKSVFYQIYPRSFMDTMGNGIGDLQGVIEKLDYLNDGTLNSLGIDAIWFSPFFVSPDLDFGYDVADYCDIATCYGTLQDFDRLVEEAHRRNIRIMLDLVVNHSSDEHPWFKESRSSRDNPKRDWYIWRDGRGPRNRPPNNWKNNFFGPAWTWDKATGQYYLHSFLKEQPDLNWFNPAVREAVHKVIRFWLERGVDGFRLDVAHFYCKDEQFRDNPPFFHRLKAIGKTPFFDRPMAVNIFQLLELPELQDKVYTKHHPETHRILKGFRQILDEYPAKASVGEVNSENPAIVASYYGDNDELHMNFYFALAQCRWKAGAFRRSVERWERYFPGSAWPAYTFSNHDIMRGISRYGRRGREDMRARLLAMLLLTLRGTPFIYYGEEIGMKEVKLPRSALKDPVGIKWFPFHRGRDGARTPMQWTGGKHAGFTAGEPWLPVGSEAEKRNVAVQEKDPDSLLNFYKQAVHLRRSLPALQEGSYAGVTAGVPRDCYVYSRELGDVKLVAALNFSHGKRKCGLGSAPGCYRILLSTDPRRKAEAVNGQLILAPLEGCLLQLAVDGQRLVKIRARGAPDMCGPAFITILVADMITEEYGSGTLSITLIHPVSRTKVLTAKVITLFLVILFILAYTVMLSQGIGTLFFGWGDRFIDRGIVYSTAEGIFITAGSYLVSSLPLLDFGLMVILLAMLFHSSGVLVGVAISLVIVSSILGQLETGLEPYLVTTYFIQLAQLILFSGSTAGIIRAIAVIVLYGAISFIATAVIFKKRNILQ